MFERLNTPEEIFSFKLGAALKMENTILEMLEDLEEAAQREELKASLRTHAGETHRHIENIERSFKLLGEEVDDSPCPAIEGLQAEGKATIKKTDDSIVDAVVLSAAAETEHHEIAVYETLVTNAEARGADEVAALLKENLDSEQSTLAHIQQSAQQLSREGIAVSG